MIIGSYDHVIDEQIRKKKFERRKIKCWGSSETRFAQASGQLELSSGGKRPIEIFENFANFLFVEQWNVGDRLKRILAAFDADPNDFRGVDGRSKISKILEIPEIGR